MKAWRVMDRLDGVYSTVVFAETRGKAHALALTTDCCENSEWNDILVTRVKALDGEYRGHTVMDWYDHEDRFALIKAGWRCEEVHIGDDISLDDCEACVGVEICATYAEYLNNAKNGIYEH